MPIALIAAAAGKDLVIGKDGDLPWHFKADLQYFKNTTMGRPVLMGRKTYESIVKRLGKPLPGRRNIVLTRDKNFTDPRAIIIHDIAKISDLVGPDETLFVIGGAEIYKQTIDIADLVYLTQIEQDFDGDAHFPALDATQWKLSKEEIASENGVMLRFRVYRKP